MGSGESKRRVIVEDADGEEIVTVTEAVVRRMKGLPDIDKTGTKQASHPSTASAPTPSPPVSRSAELDRATSVLKREAEDFYLQKIRDLQDRNIRLQKQTNEQFAIAVQEVEKKFVNVTASPVCQDLQAKVLECYQANGSEPLNCSAIVNAFATCVDRARVAASSSRMQAVS
ncbi:micos complex subunit [Plakobranchus ocellatus]|uniref:Micos complex subunit n=1 Tax=Plakobranchus ocellatus TaxID=259542 RepID=A0AAV4D8Y0_9GAST|nr:micos complex subunit [Plakobranchus ocellatus]